MTCSLCYQHYNIPLENGGLQFTVFDIRTQLEIYFQDGHLGRLICKYEYHYKRLLGNREPYHTILEENGIILQAGIDASPITSRAGVTQFPVLLTIGNIPVASHIHYPLLAAMFCAKGPKPSSDLLLTKVRRELRDLSKKPIVWRDVNGKTRSSKVYLCTAHTDYTQKCELMQHSQGGYDGCTMCKIHGTQ